jgi:hypothetical protein
VNGTVTSTRTYSPKPHGSVAGAAEPSVQEKVMVAAGSLRPSTTLRCVAMVAAVCVLLPSGEPRCRLVVRAISRAASATPL